MDLFGTSQKLSSILEVMETKKWKKNWLSLLNNKFKKRIDFVLNL